MNGPFNPCFKRIMGYFCSTSVFCLQLSLNIHTGNEKKRAALIWVRSVTEVHCISCLCVQQYSLHLLCRVRTTWINSSLLPFSLQMSKQKWLWSFKLKVKSPVIITVRRTYCDNAYIIFSFLNQVILIPSSATFDETLLDDLICIPFMIYHTYMLLNYIEIQKHKQWRHLLWPTFTLTFKGFSISMEKTENRRKK